MFELDKRNFEVDLNSLIDRMGDKMVKLVKEFSTEVFEDILQTSPIKTGTFCSSNNISLNTPDKKVNIIPEGTYESRDAAKAAAINHATPNLSNINGIKAGDNVVISNYIDYGVKLEYGASYSQAPDGVYRVAALRAENRIEDLIRKIITDE